MAPCFWGSVIRQGGSVHRVVRSKPLRREGATDFLRFARTTVTAVLRACIVGIIGALYV